jgi:hypothetical protein
MSGKLLTCLDYVTFAAPKLKTNALDFFADAMKEDGRVLLVASNASYSGYLLNGRCYPGQRMKDGIETWCDKEHGGVAPCNAPVLLFHDAKIPAIGRVVKAGYQRLWSGDDWFADWKKPARGYEKGSGYTRLHMAVTDEDAQQKFLDGRFKTFSTSFRSPEIMCSVCNTNLTDGECDHQIGKTYERDGDDIECYLVTGRQFNKECSVVNHPAQPWAVGDDVRFVENVKAALSDAQVDQDTLDRKYRLGVGLTEHSDCLMIAVADMAGNATLLTVKDGEPDTIPARGKGKVELPKKFTVPDLGGSKEAQVEDSEDGRELDDDKDWALAHVVSGLIRRGLLAADSDLNDVCIVKGASIAYISGLTGDASGHQHSVYLTIDLASKVVRGWTEGTYPTKKNSEYECHSHPIEFAVDDLNADVFAGETRDATSGENHRHAVEVSIARDAHTIPSLGECLDLAARFDDLEDADVSPARRKLLKSNAFCGPGRTIPVPDLTHADAARRIVPRLKLGAAEKAAISKAIADRVTALPVPSRDAGHHTETQDTMATTTPTPAASGGKPSSDPAGQKDPKDATIEVLTSQVSEEKGRVKTIQSDLDTTKTELQAVTKKLTDAEGALHKERCSRLALLRALAGAKPSGHSLDTADGLNAYVNELMKRTPDSINDSIADVHGSVVAKLPALKGLSGFLEDGTPPARDGAGNDLKRKLPDDPSKKGAEKEPKPRSAKDAI